MHALIIYACKVDALILVVCNNQYVIKDKNNVNTTWQL